MGKPFSNYRIEERSFVSYIKREIHQEALRKDFSERQIAEIDIIIAEITSNLIKHVGSGEILYRISESMGKKPQFEVVGLDNGPGMAEPERMMVDGVSTRGTLGQGLGAVRRLSSQFQIYTTPGAGTILYSVVGGTQADHKPSGNFDVDIRAVCVSKPREEVCGDGFEVIDDSGSTRIFFADGLGHGEQAKKAVDSAIDFFFESRKSDPVELFKNMHERIRRSRGLVGAVAILDKKSNQWKICGIGNIQVRLFNGIESKTYMSYNGAIGLNIPTSMKESVFPAERNQHLIMCSDGIQSRWNLTQYPSIFKYDNTILAAALYRDFSRGNDDASVLIAKVK